MIKKRKWRNGGRECADSTTHPVTTFSYLPTQMPPSTFSWRCNSKIFFKKMLWRRSNDVLSMLLVDDVCYIDDTFHVCGRWFYGGPPPGSADAGGCNVKKVQHGLHEGDQLHVEGSVTRFGKISPLWQNFNSLWLFFEDLFFVGQSFEPNCAKSY